MITRILLTSGGFNSGYLYKAKSSGIQTAFATANLAIRREALKEAGLFDEKCITCEDRDLTLRVLDTKWGAYYERRAIVRHIFRPTLKGLLKQWYGYAFYHPYLLKKHIRKGVEIYLPLTKSFTAVYRMPFPFRIIIRLTSFYLFHFSLALSILFHALGGDLLANCFVLLSLIFGLKHFFLFFSLKKPIEGFAYMGIRYLLNWASVVGGLVGGLRQGMIYLETTAEKNPIPEYPGEQS